MAELVDMGELDIKFEEGKLKLVYAGKGGGGMVYAEIDYFMDKLKDAIPGEIDDAIIELLKGAMKAIK